MDEPLCFPHVVPARVSASGRVARAFGGVTGKTLAVVLALVVVFTLSRTINLILVAIRDDQLAEWFTVNAKDLVSHVAMAVLSLALILPAMNAGPQAGWRRYALLAAGVILASIGCAAIRTEYLLLVDGLGPGRGWNDFIDRFLLRFGLRYGYMCAMLTLVAEFYRHETRSIEAMHRAEVDRVTLDREMAEARLQVLQAQIEPHFLFNTLANVRRLYQTDLAGGRSMLEHLMRYLEVALPRMRDNTSSLEREGTLIEAYLNVQKIRMGRRLEFAIDIPDALSMLTVPSMMLLTLVENSIKHGLNPKLDGGRVDVAARVDGERLTVTVTDTGRGFGEGTSGGGTGLANIRARLSAMYGHGAELGLATHAPTGIVATLTLPATRFADAAEQAHQA